MSEKDGRASRNRGYRLRLSSEEFDRLCACSQHARMKASDFLRMIVDNYAESNGLKNESTKYYIHEDNQFEEVEDDKQKLIEVTNIKNNSEEMYTLFEILFRFWQIGWFDQFLENVE